MKRLSLRIWVGAMLTLATAAVMLVLGREIAYAAEVGAAVMFGSLVLATIGSYAIFVYLGVRRDFRLLERRFFKTWLTMIVAAAAISGFLHYIRFIPSPEAATLLSKAVATLLITVGASACSLLTWIIWTPFRPHKFDWSFDPRLLKTLIPDLATGRFVSEHGGILLISAPDNGESDVAVAAIQAGHTPLYRSASDLFQDMAEAESSGTRKELVNHLCKVDLLVIRDLGMKRLPATAAEDLLEVLLRRCEKGAIIMTTNRALEGWGQVLGDTAAAGAIQDRFLHHAEVIRLQRKSHRMHNRRELRSKQAEEVLTGQTK